MALASAVTAAAELRDELQAEVLRSREERVVLRSLDGARIQARMDQRLEFIQRAELLQRHLRVAQSAAASALGLTDASAESIARHAPSVGRYRVVASTRSIVSPEAASKTFASGCDDAVSTAPRPGSRRVQSSWR